MRQAEVIRRGGGMVISGILLVSCTVGPDYQGPPAQSTADLPLKYKNAWGGSGPWLVAQPGRTYTAGRWWLIFSDQRLNDLEERCTQGSQDVKIAVQRIDEAQAQTRFAAAELYPNLNVDAEALNARTTSTAHVQRGRVVGSFPGLTSGGTYTGSNGPLIVQQPVSSVAWDFRVPVDLSWELDLFGRARRNVESARASAQGLEADYEAVLLSVTANLAADYFSLQALDNEAAVLEHTIATRQDALKIAEERLSSGLIGELDVQRARSDLASTQADLYSVRRSRGEVENAMGTLLGIPASNFRLGQRGTGVEPPQIPVGLASRLLQRRPDVASAERAVAAANAQIGVAAAAFFPDVRLNGTGGFETANVGDIFAAQSLIWSVGPSVTIPIFEGGRNRANLAIARARYLETVARYRAEVLQAFQDVENALVDLRTLAAQFEAQARAVAAARRALDLSRQQYEKGAVTFLDVLDAERTLLTGQRVLAQLLGARRQATVQLIKALGGGWN